MQGFSAIKILLRNYAKIVYFIVRITVLVQNQCVSKVGLA